MNSKLQTEQLRAFSLLSQFLNDSPDAVDDNLVAQFCDAVGCNKTRAFALLLAAACGLNIDENDIDKEIYFNFFEPAVHQLNIADYSENAYYKNINFNNEKIENWELKYERYKPFEAFICDDISVMPDGRQVPQIGFFDTEFSYPAVLENGRIWMTITPNEIETMKQPIQQAFGKVLTYGLGLGYFAYMVSEKSNVTSVTVVEKDKSVIELFERYILPQFSNSTKIKIVCADAFIYAEKQMPAERFNYVFTDLWHDVSDGIPLYLKMKKFEQLCPSTKFAYWIEKSMLCYL